MEFIIFQHHALKNNCKTLIIKAMMSFRSSIYSKEWLDVVFVNRNKAYGAYQLRQHSDRATTRALLIVVSISLGFSALSFIAKPVQENKISQTTELFHPVELNIEKENIQEDIIEAKGEKAKTQQVASDIAARDLIKFAEINPSKNPASDEDLEDHKAIMDRNKLIASFSMKGQNGGELMARGTFGISKHYGGSMGHASGDMDGKGADDSPFVSVEVMPTPRDGMQAFIQWIAKNYTFPQAALENNVKGLIQIKFIVEKDGSLSSFEVIKDMGFGTGLEAVKLLEKAKKWNPGVQNGKPVRVAFTLPIRLSTE